jgi:hypothetical protein
MPLVPTVELMLAALDGERCAHCAYLRTKLPPSRSRVARRSAVA